MQKATLSPARPAVFIALVALFVALIPDVDPAFGQVSLMARRDFTVGDHPVEVISADFDGDGILDLLSVDQLSNFVSLMKGFGDGTFRQLGTVTVGLTPTGIAWADVDNDGNDDIITSNFLTQDVNVNLGDGQGGFAPKMLTLVESRPFQVVTGYWDADANLDVITMDSLNDTISVLLGLGNGLFGSLQVMVVGEEPAHMVTDDFNLDGNADLAVVNKVPQTVEIYLGDGAAGFTLTTTVPTGIDSVPIFLANGDFNEDLNPDLVVSDRGDHKLQLFPGDGLGGFGASIDLGVFFGPRAVRAADVDQDGHLDLVTTLAGLSGVGELALLIGDGAGAFGAPVITNVGPEPTSIVVGDFNGDGNRDIVASSLTGNVLSFVEIGAAGAFVEAPGIPLDVQSFPFGIAVADFDGDTNADIAATNLASDDVAVALGDGLGGFGVVSTYSTGNNSGPEGIAAVDLDGDTKIDLVTMNTGNDSMSVLKNTGNSNLFSSSNGQGLGVCESPVGVAVGELSGDMIPDIAITCDFSNHLCTRIGTGGNPNSAFGPANCLLLAEPAPSAVALGQFNADALDDMAVTSRSLDLVLFAQSDGAGGVTDIPSTFPVGVRPAGMVRGDVNGDGTADVVVTNSLSGTISTYLMDGGGSGLGAPLHFPAIDSPVGVGPFGVALADFNLDGKLDAAVANSNANNVSLLLGDGFGNFFKVGDFGVRSLPLGIGVADFNGDGWPDIAVADHFTDSITVLINQSTASDPLQIVRIFSDQPTILRWGLVPGAVYDLVRGKVSSVIPGPVSIDLGPGLFCLDDDLAFTDSAGTPDAEPPPLGEAFFYMIRPIINGVPGSYGTASDGRPRLTPTSGCL